MQSGLLSKLRQVGQVPATRTGLPALLNPSRLYGMGSHVSDNDPEVIEKAQQRHLRGETKSRIPDEAPGWEEVLASDSEAVVKAERSANKTFKEMQDQTVECLHDEMDEGSGNPGGVQQKR